MGFEAMLAMASGADPPRKKQASNGAANNSPNNGANNAKIPSTPNLPPKPPVARPGAGTGASSFPDSTNRAQYESTQTKSVPKIPPKPPMGNASKSPVRVSPKVPQPAKLAKPAKPTATARPPEKEGTKPSKKMSFKEMMKQAESIDKNKLKMTVKTRDSNNAPPPPPKPRRHLSIPYKQDRRSESPKILPSRPVAPGAPKAATPAPAAQPFPELLERRKRMAQKRRRDDIDEEDDDDLDDFIVESDEEEEPEDIPTSQREEIWRLFNRNPRSAYVDEGSDDDMEASAGELYEEEKRSAAQARREDILEEKRLQELAESKLKRFKK